MLVRTDTQRGVLSGLSRERNLRSKIWWFTEFCNSHYVSHFAAFFIVTRTKISVAKSCSAFRKSTRKLDAVFHITATSWVSNFSKGSFIYKGVEKNSYRITAWFIIFKRLSPRGNWIAPMLGCKCTGVYTWIRVNDPSAGSPTETLLRLLLPLNDQVWSPSRMRAEVSNNVQQSRELTKPFNR